MPSSSRLPPDAIAKHPPPSRTTDKLFEIAPGARLTNVVRSVADGFTALSRLADKCRRGDLAQLVAAFAPWTQPNSMARRRGLAHARDSRAADGSRVGAQEGTMSAAVLRTMALSLSCASRSLLGTPLYGSTISVDRDLWLPPCGL